MRNEYNIHIIKYETRQKGRNPVLKKKAKQKKETVQCLIMHCVPLGGKLLLDFWEKIKM